MADIIRQKRQNSYISKYLDSYRRAVNTDFAVLIKGPWGCGKTYFIKNYCRSVNSMFGDDSATWYVSLNGVKTTEEIDERLYQLAHPILGSAPSRFAGRLLKGAINSGIRLSTGVEIKPGKELGAELGLDCVVNAFIPKKKVKVGARLLVLDDIERSRLDKEDIIGYISGFVEEGVKVVVVAADNIEAGKKFENNDGYTEKVIGKTFEIRNDIHDLFGAMVDDRELPLCRERLMEARNIVVARILHYDAEKCNYRALRHAFRDLEFVFEQIPARIRKSEQFLEFSGDFIPWFVPISYVVHMGHIEEDQFQIPNIFEAESYKELKSLIAKLGVDDSSMLMSGRLGLSLPILRKILWNHPFTDEELCQDILQSPAFYKKPELPDWCKYWNWFLMDDDDAAKIEDKVRSDIKRRKYVHPGEIIHVFSVLMSHVQDGVVTDLTKGTVIKEFEQYVDDVVRSRKLILEDPACLGMGAYGGYSWWRFDYGNPTGYSTQKLVEILSAKVRELLQQKKVDDDVAAIARWKKEPKAFLDTIEKEEPGEAMFSSLSAQDFIQIFIKLNNNDKHRLLLKMKERWLRIYDVRRYTLEEPFIAELLKVVEDTLEHPMSPRNTPSYDSFRRMKKYFQEVHAYIIHELQRQRLWPIPKI